MLLLHVNPDVAPYLLLLGGDRSVRLAAYSLVSKRIPVSHDTDLLTA